MFNTATSARLWWRDVAPAGSAGFEALDATQSLVMRPDLNTEGSPEALLATPGYVAAWSPAADGRWAVTGLRPGGGTAWTSSRFPGAVFLANDASTVYVITCTHGNRTSPGCARRSAWLPSRLSAAAAGGRSPVMRPLRR